MAIDGGLRPIFRDRLRVGFDWTSVETGGTGRGVPDSNCCAQIPNDFVGGPEYVGVEFWVEYKQTTGWACTLRPEQIGWILRRTMHGGRVFVATRRRTPGGPRSPAADELFIHQGAVVRELRDTGLLGVPWLFRQDGGPSAWNWDDVRRTLTT